MRSRLLPIVVAASIAIAGAAACSSSTAPPALTVGVYNYSSSVPFLKSVGSLGTSAFGGTRTLTYVAAESIAGTFQVSGFESSTTLGFKQADAYLLYNKTTSGSSTLGHRIRPDLGCTVRYIPSSVEGTCTLTKQ
jgi:hypothetical protein